MAPAQRLIRQFGAWLSGHATKYQPRPRLLNFGDFQGRTPQSCATLSLSVRMLVAIFFEILHANTTRLIISKMPFCLISTNVPSRENSGNNINSNLYYSRIINEIHCHSISFTFTSFSNRSFKRDLQFSRLRMSSMYEISQFRIEMHFQNYV